MGKQVKLWSFIKYIIFPIVVWAVVIVAFLNVKNLPFDLNDQQQIGLRYFVKFIMTIMVPLAIIKAFYDDQDNLGLNFSKFSDSFKLAIRSYAIGGPAGITFLLIGYLGWGIKDWPGAITLSLAYLLVFYFVPKVTLKLPTRKEISNPNKMVFLFTVFSFLTCITAYYSYDLIPILSKVLYYIFIVGLGEELLFRGYLQSSFNKFFGKPFKINDVNYGWGLILAALLFGLIHALVTIPPTWPWALFTFVLGLTLGFIREKDGSILAAVLLHAMFDLPLVIFSSP